ncbi:response regulator [Hahella sp. KA22]|uniref:response regulator transcription factor n=1 Tax=Hahella sp. KA22 TaxID=1628392 RepID=UPI000FDD12A5|nr:response regulator transcription factor [Hahella sp. KA22]AZZ89968.1 response regulator transcription factor [Hahella sp. KA22]QAY53337.1 response regulator [Hahella sp. KA22]
MIRLVLVDDHILVLEGIRARLEQEPDIDVVAQATDGKQAIDAVAEHRPDVVMMDVSMPRMNGIDATEYMAQHFPDTRVLILSMHNNKEYVSQILHKGAKGYILKDVSVDEMIRAIRTVYEGGTYISSGASAALFSQPQLRGETSASLTHREASVLKKVAEGKSNKAIAEELAISVRTVETHRQNIKAKLGLSSTAELTKYAIKHGLM